jgi:hypothetical protein
MLRVLLVGTGLLTLAGALQLWEGRLSGPTPIRKQLLSEPDGIFSSTDRRNPRRIVRDRAKLSNAGVVCCELLVMTMTAFMLIYSVGAFSLPTIAVALLSATYALGAYLVGRAVYIRLGFGAATTSTTDGTPVPELEVSLAETFGDAVETDFAAITSALDTARGNEATIDAVTAVLLAGARAGESEAALKRWGADADVASPEAIAECATRLVEDGVLADRPETEPLSFIDDRLADADPDQVAAVTASVVE